MANCDQTRITEKRYYAIPAQALTANGTATGLITIASTYCFKVGQVVLFKQASTGVKRAKIQRVISETQFIVIEQGECVTTKNKLDMSAFMTGDTVELLESRRPVIDLHEIQRQVYEEEPTVALRSHLVDWLGRSYCTDNPMPVQLSDGDVNIGTVNAELEVQLSHQDNVPNAGDIADSVQIGDGTEILEINPDGSINASISNFNLSGTVVNTFDTVASVVSAATTDIVTYTVPMATTGFLDRAEFTGCNIGTYELLINGTVEATQRTWFSGGLSGEFNFISSNLKGIPLVAGDIVKVRVTHNRPNAGDFEARIQVVEI